MIDRARRPDRGHGLVEFRDVAIDFTLGHQLTPADVAR
jgi:hypothetical protein